jgi:hypothetical protein
VVKLDWHGLPADQTPSSAAYAHIVMTQQGSRASQKGMLATSRLIDMSKYRPHMSPAIPLAQCASSWTARSYWRNLTSRYIVTGRFSKPAANGLLQMS